MQLGERIVFSIYIVSKYKTFIIRREIYPGNSLSVTSDQKI